MYLKSFCKKRLLNLVLSLFINKSTKESNARLKLNLHLQTKKVFTGFIDKFESKDKALPVKTTEPNFVTFFVYFGNSTPGSE